MATQGESECVQGLRKLLKEITPPRLILPPDLSDLLLQSDRSLFTVQQIQVFQNYIKSRERTVTADEVVKGVFVGDERDALDKTFLKDLGITHVLNASEGTNIGQINTSAAYYEDVGIKYFGLKMIDSSLHSDLHADLDKINQFIGDAINVSGRVLVHCQLGVSRSPTIVGAYLITCQGFSAEDAVRRMRQMREIIPNDGFLDYLCALDAKYRGVKS